MKRILILGVVGLAFLAGPVAAETIKLKVMGQPLGTDQGRLDHEGLPMGHGKVAQSGVETGQPFPGLGRAKFRRVLRDQHVHGPARAQ